MKKPLVPGDYVLATKWSDGDPRDHFVVGFFTGMLGDRFLVEDSKGKTFRPGGFRRCERISARVGHALVMIMPIIGNVQTSSLWSWRRSVKNCEEIYEATTGHPMPPAPQ